jgi:hypothetical protein
LPLFTTFIAWILFLPVRFGAWILDAVVTNLFGTPINDPHIVVLSALVSSPFVHWAVERLTEHRVTELLIKAAEKRLEH